MRARRCSSPSYRRAPCLRRPLSSRRAHRPPEASYQLGVIARRVALTVLFPQVLEHQLTHVPRLGLRVHGGDAALEVVDLETIRSGEAREVLLRHAAFRELQQERTLLEP